MRLYDICIFESDAENLDSEGLCGPLMAESCTHKEATGANSEVELIHPYDDVGKWQTLVVGRILRCWTQTKLAPEIDGNEIVTSVEKWTVSATATKAERQLYSNQHMTRKVKVLPPGEPVTVVKKIDDNCYKIKSAKYGTGYISPKALEFVIAEVIPGTVDGIETVEPGVIVRPQYFEIYEVDARDDDITVRAKHITYQLLSNLTTYTNDGSVKLSEALDGIMDGCMDAHEFHAHTNIGDERTGVDWTRINPIKAFMDPDVGVLARWGCELIRDNWDMYFLSSAGRDRGVAIETGKNLVGIQVDTDISEMCTRVIPVGTDEDGQPMLLPEVYIDAPTVGEWDRKFYQTLDVPDATVGDGVTLNIARARMREAAANFFADGTVCAPKTTVKIEIAQLDGIEGMELAAQLEPMTLYDTVHVRDASRGIDARLKVKSRTWDCIRGQLEAIELGSASGNLGNLRFATWQVPKGISGAKIAPGTIGVSALSTAAQATDPTARAAAAKAQADVAALPNNFVMTAGDGSRWRVVVGSDGTLSTVKE